MKQVVVILFLLVLELTTSAQSRILTGTVAAAPNASTTILPHIVVAKSTEGQKEDSALYNPRYVPPPPVDSSKLNVDIPAQSQNVGVAESNYQYKTPDSKPYVDGKKNTFTPSVKYQKPQPLDDGTEVYQYKTLEGKPIINSKVQAKASGFHYPKRVATQPVAYLTKKSNDDNITNPDELAANSNYGNVSTAKSVSKWQQKEVDWNKTATTRRIASNNSITPVRSSPSIATTSAQASQSLNPSIGRSGNVPNESANNNNSLQENLTQRSDYKVEITADGKFTVTFYNNGSNIMVTSFGRIAGVSSPANGNNTTQQYDYRGLLQSVGGLPLQYTYEGRLQSVGNTNLGYNYNGNIQSIGNTPIYYNYNGTVDKIGNTRVVYDANGSVSGTNGANTMITIKQ